MKTASVLGVVAVGFLAAGSAACTAPAQSAEDIDRIYGAVEESTSATLPSGSLQAKVIQIAGDAELLDTVTGNDGVYIHTKANDVWYFKSGGYLLGVESFTQYDQHWWDAWVAFGSGGDVAPRKARVVGSDDRGQGWVIPSLENGGKWPSSANKVWIVGTNAGVLAMGDAPEGIALGTEVFGSMQAYGNILSTPYLEGDDSPSSDSTRIQGLFSFNASTVLGGHSAGSSAARRLAIDLGLTHVWLYGTPNYSRKSGAYTQHESHGMVAEVINNDDDPVTNCLADPLTLTSLAWGTAKCHDYSDWDYGSTSPEAIQCP